jgi:predicted ArsR family transcriptional regulator
MTNEDAVADPVRAIALLDEPTRRRLYEFVSANREAVGRDDAAAAIAISRELAAFHLDRLVAGGLLETEYRRRSGRTGPGAGRPAKLYRRADREVAVTIPPRQYDLAADVFAEGIGRMEGTSGVDAVADVARERGAELGSGARRKAGTRPSRSRRLTALVDLLRGRGYEPEVDEASEAVRLRNCPYHALASRHQELTCGMNLAWAEGVATAIDSPLQPELAPTPGYCCVVFRPPSEGRETGASELIQQSGAQDDMSQPGFDLPDEVSGGRRAPMP